jgi:FkbM family methyltransferase
MPVADNHPPAWAAVIAGLLRRVPRGRYRYLSRLPAARPFRARFPPAPQLRFTCDLNDAISREVYFAGSYEPQLTLLLRALTPRGGVALDLGANWGYFSLLLAALVGEEGRVVSLEPEPRLFQRLQTDVAANALSWVESLEAAAAGADGHLWLEPYPSTPGNWGVSRAGTEGQGVRVQGRGIDRLLDTRGLERIDMTKMDIEGAEVEALHGMEAGLQRQRYRYLLIEWHPGQLGQDGLACALRLLSDAGYRGWTIDHSKRAMRQAAYRGRIRLSSALRLADDWPHALFVCPQETARAEQRLRTVATFA